MTPLMSSYYKIYKRKQGKLRLSMHSPEFKFKIFIFYGFRTRKKQILLSFFYFIFNFVAEIVNEVGKLRNFNVLFV